MGPSVKGLGGIGFGMALDNLCDKNKAHKGALSRRPFFCLWPLKQYAPFSERDKPPL